MKAELKGLHSPDAEIADGTGEVSIDTLLVQLMIGPEGAPGEESFDLVVCTPQAQARADSVLGSGSEKFRLVLDRIDIAGIRAYIDHFLRDLERPTWEELAVGIGRIAKWEFQDYRP
ncbi:Imm8 family immunity protein [Nocardia yamanashiensis]|uniref:Imm8 family immunity protein n=1 Tax=Nocardia yamanashiensis TaxID=209247 RepID=UPI000829E45C|nr:Imm8 family immunity protein [Nocardia yamanashiensis]